jgi:hypothetical protein
LLAGARYAARLRAARPGSSERKNAWYWLGMCVLGAFCAFSALAKNLNNIPLAWAAVSVAIVIACASLALWALDRVRCRRSRPKAG